ncbi:MAG: FAD-dependent oxidoreductase [Rubrivivax sp.]
MTSKNSRLLLALALAAAVVGFVALDLGRFLSLEALRAAQSQLAGWYERRPGAVIAAFFAVYVAVTALSLPGAVPLTLAGGALFGLGLGTLVVSFASTLGATLAMLVSRHLLREAVKSRFGARLAEVDRGIARDGAFYLFTLRLVPVLPFFAINLLMGLTAMRVWTYAWVSQLGMLAGTLVYVNAGTQLAQISSVQGIVSPSLLGAFALLGVLPLAGRWLVSALKARRALAPWRHLRPKRFDRNLVVIGAGAAGLVTSYISAAVKARVTLVEAHRMGGDCLNTGCVPSKALIRAATLAQEIREAHRYGVRVVAGAAELGLSASGSAAADCEVSDTGMSALVTVDFPAVMARVAQVVRDIEPNDSVERYRALGVDVQLGRARIVDPWHVEITQADGQTQTLSTRAIVIATGARPIVPPLPGLQAAGVLTSDTLWGLRELPPRLLVLGGGPIGCELAQAFARLGSQVTLVELGPRLLPKEDEDAACHARRCLEADGVTVLTGHRALRCEAEATAGQSAEHQTERQTEHQAPGLHRLGGPNEGQTAAPSVDPAREKGCASDPRQGLAPWRLVTSHDGVEHRIAFDRILCAVGRSARLEGFGLEALGLDTSGRTLPVDEHLQTVFPHILACGDVAGPYQFTHAAAHQAWYAAVNGLFGTIRRVKVDHRVIPWCTFLDPEIARVGLHEQEAAAQGVPFEVTRFDLDELDRVIVEGGAGGGAGGEAGGLPEAGLDQGRGGALSAGWVKVLTVPGKDRILGVTIVGRHAGELLAEWVMAMKHGLGLNKVLGTLHVYPTLAESAKYAAGAWKRAHQPEGLLRWVERFHAWRRG